MSSIEYQREYYDKYLRASRGYAPLIDRSPAAMRVWECLEIGMSIHAIATAAGVSEESIRLIDKRPSGKITQAVADGILSVRPVRPVTPQGITRRLQALNRLGWTTPQIAAEASVDLQTIKRWRNGKCETVGPGADAIIAAYNVLSMRVPTPEARYERSAATRTVHHATQNGWPPPLAWDDGEIDNPDAIPDMGAKVRGVDINEWLYLVRNGEDPHRAAVRMGVQLSGIDNAARRAGRQDIRTMTHSARNRERAAS